MDPRLVECIDHRLPILLHGPGGTGKSHTICKIASYCREKGISCRVTAMTGVAAVSLGGHEESILATTFHRGCGVPVDYGKNASLLLERIRSRPNVWKVWKFTEVLIIDEISMMSAELFQDIDYVARSIRSPNLPFGGMCLICSGDFLQLPPVKANWVFKSRAWREIPFVTFSFVDPKRYNDREYFELLMRARKGECTEEDDDILERRLTIPENSAIKPSVIYSRKTDVDVLNLTELNKLELPENVYLATDLLYSEDGIQINREDIRKIATQRFDENIRPILPLRVGAQVMLKVNLDPDGSLVNGSRGIVTEIFERACRVLFANGAHILVNEHKWRMDMSDLYQKPCYAVRAHIPLILAWAVSVHSSQGSTLDMAVCDVGYTVFCAGQAYVALSRVRTLSGLYLSAYKSNRIYADKEALSYVEEIEKDCLMYGHVTRELRVVAEIVFAQPS